MISRAGRSLLAAAVHRAFAKELLFSNEARAKLMEGADILADAVKVTLGPSGRNVLIEQSFGSPKITKDGVTVAKAIDLPDKAANIGANLIKNVASKTNDEAGDGTTTATVLARSIFQESLKYLNSRLYSCNTTQVKKGMDLAVAHIVERLKAQAVPVKEKEVLEQVATISANGDRDIGKIIAETLHKVGEKGSVTVTDGKTLKHEVEYIEGMKFDQGYVSPYFATNLKTQKVEFDDAFVLLLEKKVSNVKHLLNVLQLVRVQCKPLLIIADDFESEVLTTLILNKIQGIIRVCCVKAPSFGDNRKNIMADLQVFTGGKYINEEIGLSLENEDPAQVLGKAKRILVTKDDFVLIQGAGSKEAIDKRAQVINEHISLSTSDYDKEKMRERISKLKGSVANIKVGGASQVEIGEVKDRINDALCATRAAIAEGIVAGGGSALIYASRGLDELKTANQDQKNGVQIIKHAVQVPLLTIVGNAGFHDQGVLKRVQESKELTFGFDAQTGEFKDMVKSGIIDPAKVVRTALQDAVSVSSMMMTTECIIFDEQKKEDSK